MNVQEARTWATGQLAKPHKGGVPITETPLLDTLLILGKVRNCTQEELLLQTDSLSEAEEAEFRHSITLRLSGLPVAYILGKKEFYGREFVVTQDVLIPRSDTEVLIEVALKLANRWPPEPQAGEVVAQRSSQEELASQNTARANESTQHTAYQVAILDLCTGSGCIGITIKAELPQASVTCADLSAGALEVCKRNSHRLLGSETAVHTVQSNLFEQVTGRFDIILTNPPYLTNAESDAIIHKGWQEPDMAFRAGADGLDLIRTIIAKSPKILQKNGYLCIEAADNQAKIIASLLTQAGFIDILHHTDLSGARRVTLGRMP